LAVLLASCGASDGAVPSATPATALTAADLQLITAGEAYALVDDGTALLYDTRSLEEYQALHAAGAISFPEADVVARYGELPTDKGLIFY
jgi:rhodanese-related sulfurtransferase